MDSLSTYFQQLLLKEIASQREEKVAQLAAGAAHSYEDYRERVGYIRALEACVELADIVESKINGARDVA